MTNLLKYRTDAGLTIVELSKKCNVSKSVIQRLEKNHKFKKQPHMLTLKKIYRYLKRKYPKIKFKDLYPEWEIDV